MASIWAMVLDRPGTPLVLRERPVSMPAAGEILVEIAACGVCRTDLHVVDGELPDPKLPICARGASRVLLCSFPEIAAHVELAFVLMRGAKPKPLIEPQGRI